MFIEKTGLKTEGVCVCVCVCVSVFIMEEKCVCVCKAWKSRGSFHNHQLPGMLNISFVILNIILCLYVHTDDRFAFVCAWHTEILNVSLCTS